jgi:mannose-6-phosphate isomerase-like protein (cupin superfamily)
LTCESDFAFLFALSIQGCVFQQPAIQPAQEVSMAKPDRSRVIRFSQAQTGIPSPAGDHAVSFLQHGTLDAMLSLGRFARRLPPNEQTTHAQDEVYFVIHGQGVLLHDGKRDSFEAGDLLFVAAGTEHRFEDFTEDLAVWVVFYGPRGGEVTA